MNITNVSSSSMLKILFGVLRAEFGAIEQQLFAGDSSACAALHVCETERGERVIKITGCGRVYRICAVMYTDNINLLN